MLDHLDLLKRCEKAHNPEKATVRECPQCRYTIRTETPILDGFNQIGAVCTCARCSHQWKTWRKDSHRLAHIAACDQPIPRKDMEHG